MTKSWFWRSRKRWLYGCVSGLTALSIIVATPQASYSISWLDLILRGVQIIQLSSISDRQEIKLGKSINNELIESGRVKLYRNRELNEYINNIGQTLAKNSSRPNIPYTFQIVDDRSVNAFATMGGYVYVHKGLITTAENEAELASVIAHEIGHVAGRHAIEQMRERAIAQGVLTAAGLDESTAVQLGVQVAVSLPHSRKDEYEADTLGLATSKKAGYAPIGTITFMQKLLELGGRSNLSILSTHPATSERITRLEAQIDSESADRGNGLDKQAYRDRIRSLP